MPREAVVDVHHCRVSKGCPQAYPHSWSFWGRGQARATSAISAIRWALGMEGKQDQRAASGPGARAGHGQLEKPSAVPN